MSVVAALLQSTHLLQGADAIVVCTYRTRGSVVAIARPVMSA